MNISEMISKLERIKERRGNVPVLVDEYNDGFGGLFHAEVEDEGDCVTIVSHGEEYKEGGERA